MRKAWMACLLACCAFGGVRGGPDDGGPRDASGMDAARADASAGDGGADAGRIDAGRIDAGPMDTDAGRDAGPSSPLDPALDPADPSGTPCDPPGSSGDCALGEVCRFYSATESFCESCEPCGNLGDFCSASSECDILFACYQGVCTNICPLGTYYCGPIEDCLDIGHPTHGVCRP